MNTALTTNSYISASPARKAFAFKPSYKTACRVAIGINTVLASAFLLSFPLLRIANAKCPVITDATRLANAYKKAQPDADAICLYTNSVLQAKIGNGCPERSVQQWKHLRYTKFIIATPAFKAAHCNWRFDY